MGPTIYAQFESLGQAEKALGALLDHGCRPEHVSLLSSEGALADGSVVQAEGLTTHTHGTVTRDPAFADSDHLRHQPLRGDIGDLPIDSEAEVGEIPDPHGRLGGGAHPSRLGDTQYSAERSSSIDPTSGMHLNTMSIDDALTHSDWPREQTLEDPAHPETQGLDRAIHDTRAERVETDSQPAITTTTAADAASGAVKGAGIGLGVGVLAALAAVFVPGIGLVAGGGALAAAMAGAAATTAAGAAAGGVAGYLKDQGVPEEVLTRYNAVIGKGGALVAVSPSERVGRADVEAILAKYGAINVDTYGPSRAA